MSTGNAVLLALVSLSVEGVLCVYTIKNGIISYKRRISAGDKVMPLASSTDGDALFAHTRGLKKEILYYPLKRLVVENSTFSRTAVEDNFVYLAVSPFSRFLYAVSYEAHRLVVFELDALKRGESLVVTTVENIPHAHCVAISPDERFVYISSLSAGFVATLQWQCQELVVVGRQLIAEDFGPRHIRLNTSSERLYAISEFQGRIATMRVNPQTGLLTLEEISSWPAALAGLKDGFPRPAATDSAQLPANLLAGLCWGSEIQITPDEGSILIAERTSSRILLWQRNSSGCLICRSWIETETQPRSIQLSPCGDYLMSCGEKSSMVALYKIDHLRGKLVLLDRAPGGYGANYIEIIELLREEETL
ncbi:TPA: beta-propeller fold lactonase family protein [Klebsiella pneumoniae]|nr:beta-propeller fold lactonase family protein [Klebsiella pneumoniae]